MAFASMPVYRLTRAGQEQGRDLAGEPRASARIELGREGAAIVRKCLIVCAIHVDQAEVIAQGPGGGARELSAADTSGLPLKAGVYECCIGLDQCAVEVEKCERSHQQKWSRMRENGLLVRE